MPSCEDDLTLTDLLASSSASSRLTSGSSATTNLYAQIDRDQVSGLNIDEPRAPSSSSSSSSRPSASISTSSSSTPLSNGGEGRAGEAKVVIKTWEERDDEFSWVDSGVDDELILTIPFIQNVRVRSILVKTGRGEYCPSVLRIYANRAAGLTFPDSLPVSAGGLKPSQEIALLSSSSSTLGVTEYPLKVSVFTDVVSLSLYFGASEGGEKTRIYFVGCNGDPRNPSKSHDSEMTIPAAQGADAPIDSLRETATPRNSTIR
ncbi:PITH domain-containing protein [Mrakia frigida]|uniref:PITH domain-containing protein n=1 Tax=Mrakia frigida TaxID=29902 RepID=UPI003FCC0E19